MICGKSPSGSRLQRGAREEADETERSAPGHWPPARSGEPAVGEQQEQEAGGEVYQKSPRPRGEPCRRLGEAPRGRTAGEAKLGVSSAKAVDAHYQAHAAEEPAYGVAGLAGGDDGAYHREGQDRNQG